MTCIVGFVEGNKVWMGGDSAGTDNWLGQDLYDSPKVFRNESMLIGSCGSARQRDLLRWALKVPDHDPRQEIEKFMVKSFIDAVRECFKAGGVAELDKNVESSSGHFLVGYKGRLFAIYSDYQVRVPKLPYAALGCGEQIALGSMYASEHHHGQTTLAPAFQGQSPPPVDARGRVELALRASERFSAGVRGPFTIESLDAS